MSLMHRLSDINAESVITPQEREELAEKLRQVGNFDVYRRSVTAGQKSLFFLLRRPESKSLGILSREDVPPGFTGSTHRVLIEGVWTNLVYCGLDGGNAAALRSNFAFLAPRAFGLDKSFGCGDRLGLATPGHIRAARKTCGGDDPTSIRLSLAQQSMRENARTGRTPQSVVDDAVWGVFEEGWRVGYAADADHLKSVEDIDLCVAAGYTFYTIDPGEHVDESADTLSGAGLTEKAEKLPWGELETDLAGLRARLTARPIDLGSMSVRLAAEEVVRAAVKYGRVIRHTVKMYRHLVERMGDRPFDLEMSVDETNTVTSPAEHIYVASELKRLGVKWVSLAPRYVGRFEKGVDYLGADGTAGPKALAEFEKSFAGHVAVARALGPYKLSLHSGSDKFSIYPIYARLAGELVHVKTAGTSYLEALRALSRLAPPLFRDILCFALERYATDRATYHVSAEASKVPDIGRLRDEELPQLLDNFEARQVLHVTFGSVLKDERFRGGLYQALEGDEEVYYETLEDHFSKHLSPFCG